MDVYRIAAEKKWNEADYLKCKILFAELNGDVQSPRYHKLITRYNEAKRKALEYLKMAEARSACHGVS